MKTIALFTCSLTMLMPLACKQNTETQLRQDVTEIKPPESASEPVGRSDTATATLVNQGFTILMPDDEKARTPIAAKDAQEHKVGDIVQRAKSFGLPEKMTAAIIDVNTENLARITQDIANRQSQSGSNQTLELTGTKCLVVLGTLCGVLYLGESYDCVIDPTGARTCQSCSNSATVRGYPFQITAAAGTRQVWNGYQYAFYNAHYCYAAVSL